MRRPVKFLLFGLLVWTMVATLLRALRWPNDFAEAHWLVDYRYGFVKRGIVGSITGILSRIGIPAQTESTIAVCSAVALGLFCLLLLAVCWRILSASQWNAGSYLLVTVFAGSPYVVMSAHLNGYFDNILVVLSFAAAWLVLRGRPWPAAWLGVVAVLIHESVLLVGFPLVLLAVYVRATRAGSGKLTARSFLPFLLPALAFVCLVASETIFIDRELVREQLTLRLSSVGFVGNDRDTLVPLWLTSTFAGVAWGESPRLFGKLTDLRLILAVAPSTLVALYFIAWQFRIPVASRLFSAIALVTLSPLAIHLVALDTARVFSYTILCAFSCAWLLCEAVPVERYETSSRLVLLALLTLAVNVFVHLPLMDSQVERLSPFWRAGLYAPVLGGVLLVLRGSLPRNRQPLY